jgi:sec-independent protein translocase protein TatC
MKRFRRHAIVVILVVSAVITPPDVFSQILIALPLSGLYEISIIISKRVNKRRDKELYES